MSDDGEVRMVAAFGTADHNAAAHRVRNMLAAAGIQAEVCPAHQYVLVGHAALGLFPEAPWYVTVPDDHAERARDLAERWNALPATPRPSRDRLPR